MTIFIVTVMAEVPTEDRKMVTALILMIRTLIQMGLLPGVLLLDHRQQFMQLRQHGVLVPLPHVMHVIQEQAI